MSSEKSIEETYTFKQRNDQLDEMIAVIRACPDEDLETRIRYAMALVSSPRTSRIRLEILMGMALERLARG